MTIITNVFGTEFNLKRAVTLDRAAAPLRDVLAALRKQPEGPWIRLLKEDLSPTEGGVILVNGRNVHSLKDLDTEIHDGDELTFTVLVAGG